MRVSYGVLFLAAGYRLLLCRANYSCVDAVRRCQYTPDNTTRIRTESVGTPMADNVSRHSFSQLLRYEPKDRVVSGPIAVNDAFLTSIELLYNNSDQLRTLLTLLRSDAPQPWIKFMRGYSSCTKHSIIFTCYRDICEEHDLTKLSYVPNIFAEDIVGFEMRVPFNMSVIVAARNRFSKTVAPIRIPVNSIGLFNAVFNAVKYFFRSNGMRDAPVLRHLDEYRKSLSSPYRERPSYNYIDRS